MEETEYWTFKEQGTADDDFWSFEEIAFSCQKCDFVGGSGNDLEGHIEKEHPHSVRESPGSDSTAKESLEQGSHLYDSTQMESPEEEERSNLQCKECPFVGKTQGGLTYHTWVIHQRDNANIRPLEEIEDKGNEKTDCSAKVINKVESEKKFNCDLCLFESPLQKAFMKHLNSVHSEEKVDKKCRECGFDGDNSKAIEVHLRDDHSDTLKPIRCDQCLFSVLHVPTLEAHVKDIHEVLNCKVCGYKGNSYQSLKAHVRFKHDRNQVKCLHCDFQTDLPPQMKRHKRIEHGFRGDHVCETCGDDFSSDKLLVVHRKCHSGQKNLKCGLCNFRALRMSSF